MLKKFKHGRNLVVVHQYRLSCNFEILMSKKLGDWVKVQNITWYSNFLMIKYDNQR